MEFFEKISKKASKAYKITADKTGKFAKDTKIKIKMNDLKQQINELYEEIGKKVYEKHIIGEEISIKNDLEEELTKIDVLADEIETLLNQSLELNDKKRCKQCSTLIDKNAKYCCECGVKQDDENKTTQDNENQITIEEIKQNEDKTNLEKTVEVESHVNLKEDGNLSVKDEGYDEDNEEELDDEEN